MINSNKFRQLALSFPEVVELPHFEKASFRVKNKIYATLSEEKNIACVKLSEIDQSVFCSFDNNIIFPVNNKWGKQGWTMIDLKKIKTGMLKDILTVAYKEVSKSKIKSKN